MMLVFEKEKQNKRQQQKRFFFPERIIHEYIRLDKLYTEKKRRNLKWSFVKTKYKYD